MWSIIELCVRCRISERASEDELGQLTLSIELCVRCRISERASEDELGQLTLSIELCVRCRISELANEESKSMQVRAYFTAETATLLRGRLEEPIASSLVGAGIEVSVSDSPS